MLSEILFEHRAGPVRNGRVNLLKFDDAILRPGFISCFGMPKDAQNQILETNTTSGLKGTPLFAELLYLDFDDNDKGAADAESTLKSLGLAYELFSTGRPGRYHFHIPCTPMLRTDLPFRVKAWVNGMFHGTDDSLYKTSGVIRTEGTFHTKLPGKFKHLLHSVEGSIVDIMKETKDVMPKVFTGVGEADAEAAEVLERLWLEPCFEGGRNRQVYRRAYLAKIAGKGIAETEELLRLWNELMVHPPLREGEIITTVRSAYRG